MAHKTDRQWLSSKPWSYQQRIRAAARDLAAAYGWSEDRGLATVLHVARRYDEKVPRTA